MGGLKKKSKEHQMTNRNVCITFSVEKIVRLYVGLVGEEFSDGLVLSFMGHRIRGGRFVFYLLKL